MDEVIKMKRALKAYELYIGFEEEDDEWDDFATIREDIMLES